MKSFLIVHNDGAIVGTVDDDGFADLKVANTGIWDSEVVALAIERAYREGATHGTLWTGDVANDQIARMHRMRAATGATWLDGLVTQLEDGPLGPQFRVDWDEFPRITGRRGGR